jgi:hypothetical protein
MDLDTLADRLARPDPADAAPERATDVECPPQTRPEWLGFTRHDLRMAAGGDWFEVKNRPEVLEHLARALWLARQRGQAAEPGPEPTPSPSRAVSCGACMHFAPNPHGAGGLGSCRIKSPASARPPTLWPMAAHYCRDHKPRIDDDEQTE